MSREPPQTEEKAKRLAEALRANLKRRKQAKRRPSPDTEPRSKP